MQQQFSVKGRPLHTSIAIYNLGFTLTKSRFSGLFDKSDPPSGLAQQTIYPQIGPFSFLAVVEDTLNGVDTGT